MKYQSINKKIHNVIKCSNINISLNIHDSSVDDIIAIFDNQTNTIELYYDKLIEDYYRHGGCSLEDFVEITVCHELGMPLTKIS